MQNKVAKQLQREKHDFIRSTFWSNTVSIFSIIHGIFLIAQVDYLLVALDAYFFGVNEDIFGLLLIVAGVGKMVGVRLSIRPLKRISIVMLCTIWGMLAYTSLFWSFGIGYPSDSFIDAIFMVVACWRVAYKGVAH